MTAQAELYDIIRRDRRRQVRRRKFGEAVADFLVALVADAVHAFVQGWMLMLAVSVVHDHWIPSVPGIGYWWAVLIVWLLRGSFSAARKPEADR